MWQPVWQVERIGETSSPYQSLEAARPGNAVSIFSMKVGYDLDKFEDLHQPGVQDRYQRLWFKKSETSERFDFETLEFERSSLGCGPGWIPNQSSLGEKYEMVRCEDANDYTSYKTMYVDSDTEEVLWESGSEMYSVPYGSDQFIGFVKPLGLGIIGTDGYEIVDPGYIGIVDFVSAGTGTGQWRHSWPLPVSGNVVAYPRVYLGEDREELKKFDGVNAEVLYVNEDSRRLVVLDMNEDGDILFTLWGDDFSDNTLMEYRSSDGSVREIETGESVWYRWWPIRYVDLGIVSSSCVESSDFPGSYSCGFPMILDRDTGGILYEADEGLGEFQFEKDDMLCFTYGCIVTGGGAVELARFDTGIDISVDRIAFESDGDIYVLALGFPWDGEESATLYRVLGDTEIIAYSDFSDGIRYDMPVDVIYRGDSGEAWVLNRGSGNVAVIDPYTGKIVGHIDVVVDEGYNPYDLLRVDGERAIFRIWGGGPSAGLVYDHQADSYETIDSFLFASGTDIYEYGPDSYVLSSSGYAAGASSTGPIVRLGGDSASMEIVHYDIPIWTSNHNVVPNGSESGGYRIVAFSGATGQSTVWFADGEPDSVPQDRSLAAHDLTFSPRWGESGETKAFIFGTDARLAIAEGQQLVELDTPCLATVATTVRDDLYFACSSETFRLGPDGSMTTIASHATETPGIAKTVGDDVVFSYTSTDGAYEQNRFRVFSGDQLVDTYDLPASAIDFVSSVQPVAALYSEDSVVLRSEFVSVDPRPTSQGDIFSGVANPSRRGSISIELANQAISVIAYDMIGRRIAETVGSGRIEGLVPGGYVLVARHDGEFVSSRIITVTR